MKKSLIITILVVVLVLLSACSKSQKKSNNRTIDKTKTETEIVDSTEVTTEEIDTSSENTTEVENKELDDLEILNHPLHAKLFDNVDQVEEIWDGIDVGYNKISIDNFLNGEDSPLVNIFSEDGIVNDIKLSLGDVYEYSDLDSAFSLIGQYANIDYLKKNYKYEGAYKTKDGDYPEYVIVYRRNIKHGERDRVIVGVGLTEDDEILLAWAENVLEPDSDIMTAKKYLELRYESKVHKWNKKLY